MSLSTGALTPGSKTITEGGIICVGECVSMYCGRLDESAPHDFCLFYVNIQC